MPEAPNGRRDTNTAGYTLTPCVTPFPYPTPKSSRFCSKHSVLLSRFAKSLNSLWWRSSYQTGNKTRPASCGVFSFTMALLLIESPPLPRQHRILVLPQTQSVSPCLILGRGISPPIFWSQFPLVIPVEPRHPCLDLRKVHIVSVYDDESHNPPVTIPLGPFHGDCLAYDKTRPMCPP